MTLALLAVAWFGVTALVGRRGARLTTGLGPRGRAAAAVFAAVALVIIPVSGAAVLLKEALATTGGSGLEGCGRLLTAVVQDPIARPGVTASLLLSAAVPLRLVVGVRSAWRSQVRSRQLARRGSGRLVVAPGAERLAFTAGLLRPRIVVSGSLLASVPDEHRRVVLAHEEAHRRWRHPLLLFIVEALAAALPLPSMRASARMLRLALESVADDRAVSAVGSRSVVAEAIAELALDPAPAPGFEGQEVARVRRLLDPPSTRRGLGAAVVVLGLLGAVAFAGTHAVHCAATSTDTLAVVQCRAGS